MKDIYVCNWLCRRDPLKISAILATFLKHKIIAKILEISLDNKETSLCSHVRSWGKNHSEVILVISYNSIF